MKKFIRISSLFILSLAAIVSFQNCNKVQITDLAGDAAVDPNAPLGDATAPQANTPPPIMTSPPDTRYVQEACNTPNRQKLTKDLSFPKPAVTCDWEKNGNLAPKNDYFQARIEQQQALALPPNSIICDVKFNFIKQQFLYDDHFLLTFNDAIIASSYNFDSVLAMKYNLLRYDWTKIAGMYWAKNKEGKFCVAGGACSWPVTDTPGTISLEYSSLVFQKIMSEDLTRSDHVLKFVSIGDNDEQDCEHSDVRFSVDVEFVTKQ